MHHLIIRYLHHTSYHLLKILQSERSNCNSWTTLDSIGYYFISPIARTHIRIYLPIHSRIDCYVLQCFLRGWISTGQGVHDSASNNRNNLTEDSSHCDREIKGHNRHGSSTNLAWPMDREHDGDWRATRAAPAPKKRTVWVRFNAEEQEINRGSA